MNCPRCSGLLIPEPNEYPLPPVDRCVNCGYRKLPPPEPLKHDNRGRSAGFRTTQCPRGHRYTPETTYFYRWAGNGLVQRKCLTCARAKRKKRVAA